MTRCAFCGRDPYEYVDVGVGTVAVAVTCCEFGCAVCTRRLRKRMRRDAQVVWHSWRAG